MKGDVRTTKERRFDTIFIGSFLTVAAFVLLGLPLGFSWGLFGIAAVLGCICGTLAYFNQLTTQDDKEMQLRRNAEVLNSARFLHVDDSVSNDKPNGINH